MNNKKLFQDKSWIQDPGAVVIGKMEIPEESKKWAEELSKEILRKSNNDNESKKIRRR